MVLKIKREVINGIGISIYSVKMDLKKPIPSRITIAHYPVNVFCRGHVQQCFRCEQNGHLSQNCPRKQGSQDPPHFESPTEINTAAFENESMDSTNDLPLQKRVNSLFLRRSKLCEMKILASANSKTTRNLKINKLNWMKFQMNNRYHMKLLRS